jgi:predicted transcriptional regulator
MNLSHGMNLSIPSLTPEMRQALDASGGLPIQVEDPLTRQIYLLVEQEIEVTLDEEYVRRELDKGLADIDAGRVAPWDVEEFLAEAHRRHAERRHG